MLLLGWHKSGYPLDPEQSPLRWHWSSGASWLELNWEGMLPQHPTAPESTEMGEMKQQLLLALCAHLLMQELSSTLTYSYCCLPSLWITTNEVCIHFNWKILHTLTCLKHSNHHYPLPSLSIFCPVYLAKTEPVI